MNRDSRSPYVPGEIGFSLTSAEADGQTLIIPIGKNRDPAPEKQPMPG
jgi:hypothetical protein